jgi:site-specific recombinase XerC
VRRMIEAASVRDRAIVLLMLDTGLRLSELAGLCRSDLRVDGAKVTGKARASESCHAVADLCWLLTASGRQRCA